MEIPTLKVIPTLWQNLNREEISKKEQWKQIENLSNSKAYLKTFAVFLMSLINMLIILVGKEFCLKIAAFIFIFLKYQIL